MKDLLQIYDELEMIYQCIEEASRMLLIYYKE